MLDQPKKPTTPHPTNSWHPFPDEETKHHADLAATMIMNRCTFAERAMQQQPLDVTNDTSVAAFHEVSTAFYEMHQTLMVGWWMRKQP